MPPPRTRHDSTVNIMSTLTIKKNNKNITGRVVIAKNADRTAYDFTTYSIAAETKGQK